jgi:hypothetical protein
MNGEEASVRQDPLCGRDECDGSAAESARRARSHHEAGVANLPLPALQVLAPDEPAREAWVMRPRWYVLEADRRTVRATTLEEGALSLENLDRRIAQTHVYKEALVSTVFLALDHSFGEGPPVLFETMVFGGPLDRKMDRYCTADQAIAGHEEMVERVATAIAARAKDAVKQ